MSQATNETLAQASDLALSQINFKAPEDLYMAVKHLAVDRKMTVQSIWVQAMQEFLERNGQ